ncbi:MAG: flavin reductase family protein [Anaerolineae bacterium]|uniref:flavin reductase family protein n=1 Tax=Promineifilum sp. TaxID=2664178 RepID=UPI001DA16744|nr:flavin reductase family protein [Anaerolineales bacterium]MCB8934265.1 flavin reductase family protein [Promineifilum sp.]MCO5179686.1 flavin reductase family protein [Promineifilum sp.]MCW5846813.1 flavin reductase family protein [Anaerolineae bacterium]
MPISSEHFRDALRHFPSGVTIVTIKSPEVEAVHGLTVSAFASVSPDPPLILISIDHRASAHELLEKAGTGFAVNILGHDQMELSNRFAWLKDEDRFAEGKWATAVTGAPILENALAWLDCTVYSRFPAGSHTIYIGEVQASSVPRPDVKPLLYWNRGYRKLV